MALALAILFLSLPVFPVLPAEAAADNTAAGTFEERAAAERMSRSRYRNLEVASILVIVAVGGGAIFWAISRRKP